MSSIEDRPPLETTRVTTTTTPVVVKAPASNPYLFPAILVGLQTVFIILLAIHGDYGHEPASQGGPPDSTAHRGIVDFYAMFQDIHVMIFIGFGFLMTFLKRYGYFNS